MLVYAIVAIRIYTHFEILEFSVYFNLCKSSYTYNYIVHTLRKCLLYIDIKLVIM